MAKEEGNKRGKKQMPAAFEKFAKKSNPKVELRAAAKDEKRRRKEAAEKKAAPTDKSGRPRKPITAELEGKQYERAGSSAKPEPRKREQDKPRAPRGEGRKFGGNRGEGFGGQERRGGKPRFEGAGEGFGGPGRRFSKPRGEESGEGFGGPGRRFGKPRGEESGEGFGGQGRRFNKPRGEESGEGFNPERKSRGFDQRPEGDNRGPRRGPTGGFGRGQGGEFGGQGRKFGPRRDFEGGNERRSFSRPAFDDREGDVFEQAWNERIFGKKKPPKDPVEARKKTERKLAGDLTEPMRLNRFIALAGVCSRRDADALIEKGQVTVNGQVVKELGVKVLNGKDVVICNGKELTIRQFVYVLMNKPKNVITSTEDEQGRKTVMEIVKHYTAVRVYPVGRLDRNTTGLLLFTNDGELAKKLTHPSHEFQKLYHVRLDKPVEEDHLALLLNGVELEDGFAKVDDIEYVEGAGRNEVGLKIHIGRNRIVRRLFEHLGYEVIMLDRTQYGPLHKQGLKRGTCRLLTEAEIGFLKMVK